MAAAAEPAPELGPDADPENVARQILLRRLTDQPRSRAELAKLSRDGGTAMPTSLVAAWDATTPTSRCLRSR